MQGEVAYQDAHIFAQHIVIAIECMNQSCAMDRVFSDPECSSSYKIAPRFFRTTYHALRFRFEIEVSKLFDQKGKSFDSFKNELTQNNLLRLDFAEAYKNAKQTAQKDIEQIRVRRNKIHAHSDIETFRNPDIFSEEHPFDWESIRKLLFSMLNICNWIILTQTKAEIPQLYGADNSDDFVRLFGCETEFEKYNEILKEWTGKS